jgi:hypothetical protein
MMKEINSPYLHHSTSFQISGCISPASAPISAKIVTARFS